MNIFVSFMWYQLRGKARLLKSNFLRFIGQMHLYFLIAIVAILLMINLEETQGYQILSSKQEQVFDFSSAKKRTAYYLSYYWIPGIFVLIKSVLVINFRQFKESNI